MDKEALRSVAKEYGTPAYIFDLDMLKKRIRMIQRSLGEEIRLCYAMKANPFLIGPIRQLISKYEVCSPGEFHICEKAGIDMEQIVLSGVNKERADIAYVMGRYGSKGIYTIESAGQLEVLESCAKECQVVIRALIRVTSGNQFGVDEEEICRIIERREAYPHVQIVGLQWYSGTQKKKMAKIEKELLHLDEFLGLLRGKYGYEAEELEYGPGFYVPYFTSDEEIDEEKMQGEFRSILERLHFSGRITLEMGRYIAAYCGYYLTSIADWKVNQGQRYCIVDGGIHHLTYYGQAMAMKIPHYQYIRMQEEGAGGEAASVRKDIDTGIEKDADVEKAEPWNICGSLCTVNDVIVKQLPLKNALIGDVIVFERVGAYSVTEGMYLFLSRDLPQVLFYSQDGGNGVQMIRQRKGTDEINGIGAVML